MDGGIQEFLCDLLRRGSPGQTVDLPVWCRCRADVGNAGPGDVGQAFIAQLVAQENFVATTVLSFLLFSLFAMAVSTMSSLFAASLCTVRYDILPMFWSKSASAQTRASEKAQAIRWTMMAVAGMGVAVFAGFYIADASSQDNLCKR